MQNKPNLYKKPNKLLINTKKYKISSKPNNSNEHTEDNLQMSYNSNDWESRFIKAYEDNGWFIASDDQKPIIDFISSELQREREKVLEEVREIIESSYWISGTHFVVNGKQEKMVVKSELLSKIKDLKER